MKRRRYHHGDLRHALIDASLDLLGRHGASGFSLREAARLVGVSPSAAYRHFADKDALLAAIAHDGYLALAEAMRASAVDDPLASFTGAGRAYIAFALANPATFDVMFGPAAAPPALPAGASAYEVLQSAIDRLGLDPATRVGAELVAWSAVHGLVRLLLDRVIPAAEGAAAVERVLAGAVRALGADKRPEAVTVRGLRAEEACG